MKLNRDSDTPPKQSWVLLLRGVVAGGRFNVRIVSVLDVAIDEGDVHADSRPDVG